MDLWLQTLAGEMSKEDGLVVIDSTLGNEFVWVPVDNTSDFIKVGNFNTFAALTDPSYVSYNSGSSTETAEYNAMTTSVTQYKGFYIARYEAANDGSGKAISKNNQTVWTNIYWPTAKTKANEMYPVGTTSIGNPVSTLIYGEEWDATLRYMKDISNTTGEKYIINSTGMGNYSGGEAQAGQTAVAKVKNIYDLAGNAYEWTMEIFSTDYHVVRGGDFNSSGIAYPASFRDYDHPGFYYSSVGVRPALYIK